MKQWLPKILAATFIAVVVCAMFFSWATSDYDVHGNARSEGTYSVSSTPTSSVYIPGPRGY